MQAKTAKDSDRANALLDRQHAERTVLQEHTRQIAKNGLDRVRAQAEELFHPFDVQNNGLIWFAVEMAHHLQLDVFGGQVIREGYEYYENPAHPHSFWLALGTTPAFQAGLGCALGLGMLKSSPAVVNALAADPVKQAAYIQMVQTVWAPKHMDVAAITRAKRHLVENSEQLVQMMDTMLKAIGTGDKGSVGFASATQNSTAALFFFFEVYANCWQPVLSSWVSPYRSRPC